LIDLFKMRGTTVSYFAVNQAYQLALAAQELGALDVFYCSLYDAPGKWGGILGTLLGHDMLVSRRCAGFDARAATEIPGPLIFERLATKCASANRTTSWFKTSQAFDYKVSRRLKKSESRIFIGTETCAKDSFRIAGERGMIKILDCPQVHPNFLTKLLAEAADDLGVPPPPAFDSPELTKRKAEEFEMADVILIISRIHRRSFLEAGFADEKLVEIPLWVDPELWFSSPTLRKVQSFDPLKVLFVGSIGFRKGIPYLIQAIEKSGGAVDLTLVGVNSGETDKFFEQINSRIHFVRRKSKADLREMYWNSDVLVLPSLVDTFGFVALEAMACGLPAIVTENCGVPVPDSAWRVPIMNSDAIAQRLEYYAASRDGLERDRQIAREFARRFTPERYREQIKNLLRKLLQSN
jgi:glycosyltransferase involved in cell wall biosynthesis